MALWKRNRAVTPPEALFNPAKVDLVSLSPDRSAACLYIINDTPWSGSDAQIRSLQEKIHNYVSFALDGAMVDSFPETAGLAWRIVVDDYFHPPDERTARVLNGVAERVRGHGGDLVVQSARRPT